MNGAHTVEGGGARAEALVARLADLEEGPRALPEVVALGRAAIPALEALLRGPSASIHEARCLAADALAAIGGAGAREALLRALADSVGRRLDPVLAYAEGLVVEHVAARLAGAREARAADLLLEALRLRPSAGVARALGEMADPRALPLLVECLADGTAREAALEALVRFGARAIAPVAALLVSPRLAHGYEGRAWVAARAAAAAALGRIGGPETDPPLARALRDAEPEVRLAAAEALAIRGGPGAVAAVPALLEALRDRWEVADRAGDALLALGDRALAPLGASLATSSPPLVRLRAAELAGRLRRPEAASVLAGLVGDPDVRLRAAAATALDLVPGAEATMLLVRLAGDAEAAVRLRAAAALGRRGRPSPEVPGS